MITTPTNSGCFLVPSARQILFGVDWISQLTDPVLLASDTFLACDKNKIINRETLVRKIKFPYTETCYTTTEAMW